MRFRTVTTEQKRLSYALPVAGTIPSNVAFQGQDPRLFVPEDTEQISGPELDLVAAEPVHVRVAALDPGREARKPSTVSARPFLDVVEGLCVLSKRWMRTVGRR